MRRNSGNQTRSGWKWTGVAVVCLGLAMLARAQTADSFVSTPNGTVEALAVQTDGSILLGGIFTSVGGQTHLNIARVKPNGTLDTTFNPSANDRVRALAVQPDGKIVVGGHFTQLGGQPRSCLGRLNADGTLDASFVPGALSPWYYGPDVHCITIQAGGKILIGGVFQKLGGEVRYCVARLNSDGSLDGSFVPPVDGYESGSRVRALVVKPDGSILICGSQLGKRLPPYYQNVLVRRLNADGSDGGYLLSNAGGPGVETAVLQADEGVLLGGAFQGSVDRFPFRGLARLGASGIDTKFRGSADGWVYSIAIQTDGKILVGGLFTTLSGTACTNLGRLNADGTLDASFNVGVDGPVGALGIQADGRIFASGEFTKLAGVTRYNVGRLNNTSAATESLTYDSTDIRWQRAGAGPEVSRVTFEASVSGGVWTSLPEGERVDGGWMPPWFVLPSNPNIVNIRARGYVSGGTGNGSSWFVETINGPPIITVQPASRTNSTGTTATFSVEAVGSPPFTYQWRKGSVPLVSSGNVSGAQLATLTLSNVAKADAGLYSVIVSNGCGRATSQSATLAVVGDEPIVTKQPANVTTNAGQVATFTVGVAASPPTGFQWRKGGVNLSDSGGVYGTRTPTLTLSNVLQPDVGSYSVLVTNLYGSATSQVATLTVSGDVFCRTQPANQSGNLGESAALSIVAGGTPPLSYQWRRYGTNLAGATDATLSFASLQAADAGNYTVVVTNTYGSITSAMASVTVNLAMPDAFDPGADDLVESFAIQPDGKVLLGGLFTNLNGQAVSALGRLNNDGTTDATFTPPIPPGPSGTSRVWSLAMQPNGKFLAGGHFAELGGQARANLGRLLPDGQTEVAFDALVDPYDAVTSLALQSDDRIIVGGGFVTLGGAARTNIGRLDASGALDTNFTAGAGTPYTAVFCTALQADGKILVGGSIPSLTGQSRSFLGRLNSTGTLDTGFNPGANGNVYCMLVQADGKILVGGQFTTLAGQTRLGLGRLTSSGSADTMFNSGMGGTVHSLALQADGKIIVAGNFTNLAGLPRRYLGRLNPDGTADLTFNPGAETNVLAVALQADGKLLVGGEFARLGGQARARVGRLNNTGPATESLTRNGSIITWLRGGTAPEVWRTTFEVSTNGTHWTSLGAGTRTTGGWQRTGVTASTNAAIRARGFVTGGRYNGSTWFVESVLPGNFTHTPTIPTGDGGFGFRTNRFGFNVRASSGQVVVIEASTNLVNWVPLQTNVTSSLGQIIFTDAQSGAFPRRYYRAGLYQGALPPPAIRGRNATAGSFGFDLHGIAGQTLVVEASTNLADWEPLATNLLGDQPFAFTDPARSNTLSRFYRARVR